jgi:hypothetical protein
MHLSYADDYDCERAIIQPKDPLYIWNLVTTLLPKAWHDEIGGFDELMPSWEDWEYWLRLARSGKCFARIPEPMVAYRFYTGNRRETGIQIPQELLSYITKKLEGVETMPCKTCGGKPRVSPPIVQRYVEAQKENTLMNDNDMILCTYENLNRGQHKVVGVETGINYGVRGGGGVEKFYVHRKDIESHPEWFKPYIQQQVITEPTPPTVTPPPVAITQPPVEAPKVEPPKELDFVKTQPASQTSGLAPASPDLLKPLDLQGLPGVTDKIADALFAMGIKGWEDIVELGVEGLKTIDGIGDKRATAIYAAAAKSAGL